MMATDIVQMSQCHSLRVEHAGGFEVPKKWYLCDVLCVRVYDNSNNKKVSLLFKSQYKLCSE